MNHLSHAPHSLFPSVPSSLSAFTQPKSLQQSISFPHLFLGHLRNLSVLSHSVSFPTNFCPQQPPKGLLPAPPPWLTVRVMKIASCQRKDKHSESQWDSVQNFSINFTVLNIRKATFRMHSKASLTLISVAKEKLLFSKPHRKDSMQFWSSLCWLLTLHVCCSFQTDAMLAGRGVHGLVFESNTVYTSRGKWVLEKTLHFIMFSTA